MNKNRVFLGGTCNETTWRKEIEDNVTGVELFNPVVEDWTAECQAIEIDEKENKCDVHLYVITKEMKGVFSIAEAVDSVHNKDVTTIFQVIPDGFEEFQYRSLSAVVELVRSRGGIAFMDNSLQPTIDILNNSVKHFNEKI